jgi:predicted TIM-barrel enzyme
MGANARSSATESLVGVLARRNKRDVLGSEAEAVVPVSSL